MTSVLKELFFSLSPKPRLPDDRASILMYHSVSENTNYFSTVTPKNFEWQMAYLQKKRIPVISLEEFVTRLKEKRSLEGAVAITFDDGYEDNYTNAYPILKKYGYPAIIFITTDLVASTNKHGMKMLSQEQILEMQASGLVSFGAHTKSHPRLATLEDDEKRREIIESKEHLEQIIGTRCVHFAYPYGNYDATVLQIVRDTGFASASTVKEGSVSQSMRNLELPRNSIDKSTSNAQLKGKVSRAIEWYVNLKKLFPV